MPAFFRARSHADLISIGRLEQLGDGNTKLSLRWFVRLFCKSSSNNPVNRIGLGLPFFVFSRKIIPFPSLRFKLMSFQQRLIISPFLIPVPRAIATIRNKSFEPLSSHALRRLFCSISSKTRLRPCDCLGFSILRIGFSLTHSHSLTAFEKTWERLLK